MYWLSSTTYNISLVSFHPVFFFLSRIFVEIVVFPTLVDLWCIICIWSFSIYSSFIWLVSSNFFLLSSTALKTLTLSSNSLVTFSTLVSSWSKGPTWMPVFIHNVVQWPNLLFNIIGLAQFKNYIVHFYWAVSSALEFSLVIVLTKALFIETEVDALRDATWPIRQVDSLESICTRKSYPARQSHLILSTRVTLPPGSLFASSQVCSFSCKR